MDAIKKPFPFVTKRKVAAPLNHLAEALRQITVYIIDKECLKQSHDLVSMTVLVGSNINMKTTKMPKTLFFESAVCKIHKIYDDFNLKSPRQFKIYDIMA